MGRDCFAVFGKGVAVLCLLAAFGVNFFASPEQLMVNGGVRNSGGGEIFWAMIALLGETGARILMAGALLALGVLFWRTSEAPTREKNKARGGRTIGTRRQ